MTAIVELDKLLGKIESRKDEIVALTQELIRFPTWW